MPPKNGWINKNEHQKIEAVIEDIYLLRCNYWSHAMVHGHNMAMNLVLSIIFVCKVIFYLQIYSTKYKFKYIW